MITRKIELLCKCGLWKGGTVLLFLIIQIHASATWEDMNTHGDTLEQVYYASNEYTQRYMMKLMPQWLEERGEGGLPGWVEDAIDETINNGEDGLHITEAIKLTQRYGLSEHYERMIELYREAYTLHAVDADNIRSAVVNAISSFGGSIAEYTVPELLISSPHYYIDTEYSLLLRAVAEYGDTSLVGELEDAEYNVRGRAENIDGEIDPDMKGRYLQVLGLIQGVKQELIAKGGM